MPNISVLAPAKLGANDTCKPPGASGSSSPVPARKRGLPADNVVEAARAPSQAPAAGKPVKLPFRILSDGRHVSIAGGVTFSCTRERVTTDSGVTNLWSVFRENVLLQAGCRTLNEAKNVCRAAAQQDQLRS